MSKATRRRQAGEGTISQYKLKNGETRYLIKVITFDDLGKKRQILRRQSFTGEPFRTRAAAAKGLRELQAEIESPEGYVDPTQLTVGQYLDQWLDGLRNAPQTMASYRRTVRLHLVPHVGSVPLAKLTPAHVRALYRELEVKPRADGQEGVISSRTVQYAAMLLNKALKDGVRDGLLSVNPCDRVDKPKLVRGERDELNVWTGDQVQAFLQWLETSSVDPTKRVLFTLALATGARRGELLALRWRDVDFDNSRVNIRRSLGSIRGESGAVELVEGPTKNGKSRGVDIDASTLATLQSHKRSRGSLAFELATSDSLVFADVNGGALPPDSQSWSFANVQDNWHADLLEEAGELKSVELPPKIRFHDMRHTHATVLLQKGVHPKIVQERLGHSAITVTMETYSHVLPTMQREAADAIAQALYGN